MVGMLASTLSISVSSSPSDHGYQVVSSFLDKIPQDSLANVSFSCQAFTRALMHFEMYVKNQDDVLQDQLDFMQVFITGPGK